MSTCSIHMIDSLFFFSSRRRHTRLQGDWSSDVCSSDLLPLLFAVRFRSRSLGRLRLDHALLELVHAPGRIDELLCAGVERVAVIADANEIGRASCRERV